MANYDKVSKQRLIKRLEMKDCSAEMEYEIFGKSSSEMEHILRELRSEAEGHFEEGRFDAALQGFLKGDFDKWWWAFQRKITWRRLPRSTIWGISCPARWKYLIALWGRSSWQRPWWFLIIARLGLRIMSGKGFRNCNLEYSVVRGDISEKFAWKFIFYEGV